MLVVCWWHKPCPYAAMMFDVYVRGPWCMCAGGAQETRSSSISLEVGGRASPASCRPFTQGGGGRLISNEYAIALIKEQCKLPYQCHAVWSMDEQERHNSPPVTRSARWPYCWRCMLALCTSRVHPSSRTLSVEHRQVWSRAVAELGAACCRTCCLQ